MAINDFTCEVSASVISNTSTQKIIRVICYWKNNNWRYNISHVHGWVTCNGQEIKVADDEDLNASNNTSRYELGRHDFTINKNHNEWNCVCSARLQSNSTYVSGSRSSSNTNVTIDKKSNYTVSYNANGGSGAPSNQTKWYNENLTLSSTKPTRTGYNFTGWNTKSDGTGTNYSAGATYTGNAALTLYAKWTKITYTVSYNANGGSGAPSNQTKTYGTNLTLSSTKPTRTGYNFTSWNTKSDGTGTNYSAGATYTGNAALTLYAKWTKITYTVSYNANGGSGAPSNQTKTYGTNLTLSSTKPTRTGYNFKGWATTKNGSVAYQPGATYTGNAALTLYAVWVLSYVKPRINNFSAYRCNSAGSSSETEGTYLKFHVEWATDKSASKVVLQWKKQSDSSWTSNTITVSGTSGTTEKVVGNNSITIESSYIVRAYVQDSNSTDNTTYSDNIYINSIVYPIDVHNGGNGVAFGKVSESANVADFGWVARFRKGIWLGKPINRHLHFVEDAHASTNLSDLTDTGIYHIGGTYPDSPEQKTYYGFLLVIESRCGVWEPDNQGSWVWQFLFTTTGELWMRIGGNDPTLSSWVKKW